MCWGRCGKVCLGCGERCGKCVGGEVRRIVGEREAEVGGVEDIGRGLGSVKKCGER